MEPTGQVAAPDGGMTKLAGPKKAQAFKAALLAAAPVAPQPGAAVARAAARPNQASMAAPAHPGARVAVPAAAADQAFRQRIAAIESSATPSRPGYDARNAASGALGRYQLLPVALRDLGWQDGAGGWTSLAQRHGVASEADFLASPAAQEAAMDSYLKRAAQYLAQNGALDRAGAAVPGLEGAPVPVSEAGLLAAAHRRGAGSVARYLAHRTETPAAPLSAQDQRAFAQVERRLRDFADLPFPQVARLPSRGRTAV